MSPRPLIAALVGLALLACGAGGPFARWTDADSDRIVDADDRCPDAQEDLDDFEDQDGCPEPDNDGDRVLDVDDLCPLDPEDMDGFRDEDGCPDPDNDRDQILDVDDLCPDEPETFNAHLDADGCPDVPVDTDGDGLVDNVDTCTEDPEDMDGFQDEDGCPEPDNDHDGILDVDDQCPDAPEVINGVADDDGCPDRGRRDDLCEWRSADRLFFERRVKFASGSAKIGREWRDWLRVIGGMMQTRRLVRVLLVGHTDGSGAKGEREAMSLRRAEAVRAALIEYGAHPGQIAVEGRGAREPFTGNRRAADRALNRRVEFIGVRGPCAGHPTTRAAGDPAVPVTGRHHFDADGNGVIDPLPRDP